MRSLPLFALVLLFLGIVLGGLMVFATDPLLYAVDMDPEGSVFHANPALLDRRSASSMTDLVPLMQEVIDGQDPVIDSIRLQDPKAVQHYLARSAYRWDSLERTVSSMDLNDGEIDSFLSVTEDQDSILSELMNQTAAFDTVQKLGAREENRNNQKLQASVASQGAILMVGIRELTARYVDDHATVLKISTGLGLDTSRYTATLVKVNGYIDEIEGKDLPVAEPAILQENDITFYTDPGQVTYRQPVQVFGIVSPSGMERRVTILLDDTRIAATESDLQGNYRTAYTIERIQAGTHILAASTGNITSEQRELVVAETGSETVLTATPGILNESVTGVFCNGTVMAEYPVRNAPVRILVDGSDIMKVTTARDGTFSAFLPLPPGSHTLRAEFPTGDYPISASMSDDVKVTVWAPLFSLPKLPSVDPVILYGALLLIFMAAGGRIFWRSRRKETTEAARIQEEIEKMLREMARDPGSEAALHTAITNLLDQYWAALTKDGLSDAAREAYLALASRIAQSLGVPVAFRTLTPREMTEFCAGERYAGIFGHFVGNYEKIRYGSSDNEKDRQGFENALQIADQELKHALQIADQELRGDQN